ncbi:PDR/VanB family oxidoreductase [Pseudalkalibacillus caeni]|uniref:Oxidoreductase n=1 Tax=Exobacillus caeni TaxID=2574798 RepID=A0A5R9F0L2_9BACL|nr:PDR/VanB family oxidoreductase [Pseudalkalibacillus caeni]TLS35976.1 oxidoreductase [Pseudalkalibacillus caeni]
MHQEKTIPVIVKAIHRETPYVKRFTLAPEGNEPLPRFSAGSHITTYIKPPEGKLARSYSLTNYPADSGNYQIAIRLNEASKGGSRFWHQEVKEGDRLQVSFPRNHFPLSFKAKHHVFYAAGIGITPFLSMMAELKEKGASFELHYAAKTKEQCAFYHLLKEKYPGRCRFYFSREDNAKRVSVSSLLQHKIGTHAYFCGPETFIANFTEAAKRYGYPESSVHFERFTAPRPEKLEPFEVELKSGRILKVPKEKSLLEALLEAGIDAPYSCRAGRCGSCELNVKEGQVDHYDSFLTEEQKAAQDRILTCVSRAKTRKITIDI